MWSLVTEPPTLVDAAGSAEARELRAQAPTPLPGFAFTDAEGAEQTVAAFAGKALVLRQGAYGEFVSCSGYPKCKYIKQETTGVKCPECKQGDMVQKRSKRGAFYSCNRYPKCKTSMKYKPLPQPCPKCGAEYLFEKTLKDGGTVIACSNDECDYERAP